MTDASVAIVRCQEYQIDKVSRSISDLLELLGGMDCFIRPGDNVLLKPNMLSAKPPESGIITHPIILEAIIQHVQQAGGEVRMGDSPSGVVKGLSGYWEKTGYGELAKRYGVHLCNFEKEGTVKKKMGGRTYHIAKSVLEADVVINVPKLKTHGLTLYTGAIKNLYGTLPGFQKANFHKHFPNPTHFGRVVADLYACIKPTLNIMDAIVCMEGNGPSTGERKKAGLILASTDGVALDSVASQIIGFREDEVDIIRFASESFYGISALNRIKILGVPLQDAKAERFVLPSNRLMKSIPNFLLKWAGRVIWVRPMVHKDKCTGCGACSRNCPVEAISMVDGRPVMDYDICINCLCCNESCPEGAIYQELSYFAKRFS